MILVIYIVWSFDLGIVILYIILVIIVDIKFCVIVFIIIYLRVNYIELY